MFGNYKFCANLRNTETAQFGTAQLGLRNPETAQIGTVQKATTQG